MHTHIDRYSIRPGLASDAADLACLQAAVQLQAATGGQPHPGIGAWVEDLLDGHSSVVPDDFLVAEDSATGRPVANLVELRQEWSLAGVHLPVAQIELVGTAPEHRGNRLTERLFAALQQRHATCLPRAASAARFLRRHGGAPRHGRRRGRSCRLRPAPHRLQHPELSARCGSVAL
ncbi:GCN5 N-acetyltransferase [Micromonospora sp. ATCC 39149]|nr:GNAT family N-acetyltransferase [Micromonospora sp. ATCC 39149]EEP69749.1 GCN5 N-acetyltransferase [Micromonospora sp. ATCC 39149]